VAAVDGSDSVVGSHAVVVENVPSGWRNCPVPAFRTRNSTDSTPVSSALSPETTSGGSSSTLSPGAGLVSSVSGGAESVDDAATTEKSTELVADALPATSSALISAW
jgi:hypothetical protein